MPIYSYRCDTCGFQQDMLRKMSDPPLVTCPSCGAATFKKQVTAAGFQLKGSGWYVTDFRNPAGKDAPKSGAKADGEAAPTSTSGEGDGGKPTSTPTDSPAPAKTATSTDATPTKTAAPPASGTS